MWKYFTHRNTLKYIDILPNLVKGYNHSYHRSIKLRPVEVTKDNEDWVWRTLYPGININASFKFNVGDRVTISKSKLKRDICQTGAKKYLSLLRGKLNPSLCTNLLTGVENPSREIFTRANCKKLSPSGCPLQSREGIEEKKTQWKGRIFG
ncbi:hypothetical protein HOLleu_31994 [Holothuria leucospilota]|uniref:Uncharacterized protein n=1 Tax=Holothuria leucospilota TaxID=206669 RepID=A0A9Q0YR63_HOLLE|nr:hypothetical protein HOLleu_31994 [Holothuria leucospilota]